MAETVNAAESQKDPAKDTKHDPIKSLIEKGKEAGYLTYEEINRKLPEGVIGGEELYAEAGYTALSRGRLENRLYLTESETDTDHHGADPPDEPIDVIRDALTRSDREPMATSLIRSVGRPNYERDRTRHSETQEQSVEIDDGIGW